MTTAIHTDHYEYTAREAATRINNQQAVFELYTRSLPPGRGFGVISGMARLMEALSNFVYTKEFCQELVQIGILTDARSKELEGARFKGKITGLQDGDLYFPNTPILSVEGEYGDILVIETLALSILNHDCSIASAGARMKLAAGDTPIIEAGARRTHEKASVDASVAAYITGFEVSSNLGAQPLVPTAGTVMHAFILAHESEEEAFQAQIEQYGCKTTFLVDTYDITNGIEIAINVCAAYGETPGAIRIDSGNLAEEAQKARKQLDNAGCKETKIVLSGDLDEYSIATLKQENVPVDLLQIGTALVTGSGYPAAGMVYKLVAIERADGWHSVEKKSANKKSHGGHKLLIDDTTVLHQPVPFTRSGKRTLLFDENGPQIQLTNEYINLARKRCETNLRQLGEEHLGLNSEPLVINFVPTERKNL